MCWREWVGPSAKPIITPTPYAPWVTNVSRDSVAKLHTYSNHNKHFWVIFWRSLNRLPFSHYGFLLFILQIFIDLLCQGLWLVLVLAWGIYGLTWGIYGVVGWVHSDHLVSSFSDSGSLLVMSVLQKLFNDIDGQARCTTDGNNAQSICEQLRDLLLSHAIASNQVANDCQAVVDCISQKIKHHHPFGAVGVAVKAHSFRRLY
jgi:hypothetical protein